MKKAKQHLELGGGIGAFQRANQRVWIGNVRNALKFVKWGVRGLGCPFWADRFSLVLFCPVFSLFLKLFSCPFFFNLSVFAFKSIFIYIHSFCFVCLSLCHPLLSCLRFYYNNNYYYNYCPFFLNLAVFVFKICTYMYIVLLLRICCLRFDRDAGVDADADDHVQRTVHRVLRSLRLHGQGEMRAWADRSNEWDLRVWKCFWRYSIQSTISMERSSKRTSDLPSWQYRRSHRKSANKNSSLKILKM